ncbi:MAG: triose-phosphate isomerase [Planctomycetota bacterium]
MRRPFLAANWKMHLDRAAVADFCRRLRGLDEALAAEGEQAPRLGVFPPFVYLAQTVQALAGTRVAVGAQTCRPEAQGAFTGEVAAAMVRDVGASHVIVGHSERRRIFGEDDAAVRARLDAALACGLDVIFCLGETLEERRAGRTTAVVLGQLEAGLFGLAGETLATRVTLAYEPVWAIGTGLTASPAQAQEVHALLRGRLAEHFGAGPAARVILQYGGSVKPANLAELMDCPDVDGALVGGASLEFSSFEALARYRQGAPRTAGS